MLDRKSIKHIHCIGIGGIGVGGIAQFLLKQGFKVSGSDKKTNKVTQKLEQLGATIYQHHHPDNIGDADLVVYSSAVSADNPELLEAKKIGIHLLQRAELLAELMTDSRSIVISGTHGKTTTTSLVAAILVQAKLDPSFMIGGNLNSMQASTELGTGEFFISEADESDASFLFFHPEIAVVNNIEPDHMATYNNDFSLLTKAFKQFLGRIVPGGVAILCADDPIVNKVAENIDVPTLTFGLNAGADIRANNIQAEQMQTVLEVVRPGKALLPIRLNLPGKHNVLNALAAIAVATHLGIEDEVIQAALTGFSGVGRRFNILGEHALATGSVTVVDDYGHHPTAIRRTLETAKEVWPTRRIVLAFQPHRYSRTHDLFQEFSDELKKADQLILLDVFSAGEQVISGATGADLCASIEQEKQIEFVSDIADLIKVLPRVLRPNDILILQGAGDIGAIGESLVQS